MPESNLPRRNVTLIGMAGAGKSTLGRLLAERLGWAHLDTDHYIEAYYGMPLQAVFDAYGLKRFLEIEEFLVSKLDLDRTVVSTGGSVVYGPGAVAALRRLGPVVHLEIALETFRRRVGTAESRGLAKAPGVTMEDLYHERQPLYVEARDFSLRTDELGVEECAGRIIEHLEAAGLTDDQQAG